MMLIPFYRYNLRSEAVLEAEFLYFKLFGITLLIFSWELLGRGWIRSIIKPKYDVIQRFLDSSLPLLIYYSRFLFLYPQNKGMTKIPLSGPFHVSKYFKSNRQKKSCGGGVINTSEEIDSALLFSEPEDTKNSGNPMPENAAIFSVLSSGRDQYISLSFKTQKFTNDFTERSWNFTPLAKGTLLKTAILSSTWSALAKVSKNLPVGQSTDSSLSSRTQLHSTQLDTPAWRHSPPLAFTDPFVLTCLLPTCPPLLSPPGWHLFYVSTLHPGIPLWSSTLLLLFFFFFNIIQSWALNTSCMLIIPKFRALLQTLDTHIK